MEETITGWQSFTRNGQKFWREYAQDYRDRRPVGSMYYTGRTRQCENYPVG